MGNIIEQRIRNPIHQLVGISRWGIKRGRWDPTELDPESNFFKLVIQRA